MGITLSGEGEGSLVDTLSTWFRFVAHPHEALLSLSILGFSSHLSCEHKFLSSETKIYPLQKCVYRWGFKGSLPSLGNYQYWGNMDSPVLPSFTFCSSLHVNDVMYNNRNDTTNILNIIFLFLKAGWFQLKIIATTVLIILLLIVSYHVIKI